MTGIRASFAVTATAAAAAVLLVGCSTSKTEIDSKRAEGFVRQSFPGPPKSVDCPGGVEAKAGATLTCKVTGADSRNYVLTLHIVDDKGRVKFAPSDVRRAP